MADALDDAVKQLTIFVKQNCKPFLDDLEKCGVTNHLLRGDRTSSLIEICSCPIKRRPRNTRPIYHRAADLWFYEQFGVRYRSNSLFCTTDVETAEVYGNVRRVYPIGDYTIAWSPKVYDMYFATTMGQQVSDFVKVLSEAGYRHEKLSRDALSSSSEIMLHCQAYVSIEMALDLGLC